MIFSNPADDFTGQVNQRGGFARPNYFAITFTGPASISPNPYVINAMCESVSIPGRSITTLEHGTTHQATKRPYGFINDDVTVNFLVTNDFYMKNMFDKWMRCVVNDSDAKIYYKDQYVSDFQITVLDLEHDMIYKCTLENAYPIQMNAIELSTTAENQLMRVSVTLTYDNFVNKSTYFSLETTLADLRNAIAFPNPLIPGLPFNPFGDLGDQAQTILAGVKSEVAGELSAALSSILGDIRQKINSNATTITVPYEGSLGSVIGQVSGKVSNIFGGGSGLSGIANQANSKISTASTQASSLLSKAKSLIG